MKTQHWQESHKLAQDANEVARDNAFKARHVSKYIFPRQYGLGNVFTLKSANAYPSSGKYDLFNRQKYDDREEEISVSPSAFRP